MLLTVDGAGKGRHINVPAFALPLDVIGVCGEEASARVEDWARRILEDHQEGGLST